MMQRNGEPDEASNCLPDLRCEGGHATGLVSLPADNGTRPCGAGRRFPDGWSIMHGSVCATYGAGSSGRRDGNLPFLGPVSGRRHERHSRDLPHIHDEPRRLDHRSSGLRASASLPQGTNSGTWMRRSYSTLILAAARSGLSPTARRRWSFAFSVTSTSCSPSASPGM